jgi:hypothetical protein
MVMFDHNTAPTMQGTRVGSLFTTLMNEARAKSASLLRFLYDKEDKKTMNRSFLMTTTTIPATTETAPFSIILLKWKRLLLLLLLISTTRSFMLLQRR